MDILITCLSMENLTGAELYFYELASALAKQHHVTVAAMTVNQYFIDKLNERNVKLCAISELQSSNFDLLVISHSRFYIDSISKLLDLQRTKIINVIHSELYAYHEQPLLEYPVYKYVVIRPEIKEFLINNYAIQADNIAVIYNPIDINRFNLDNIESGDYGLFVGTYMGFRAQSLNAFVRRCRDKKLKTMFIGQNHHLVKNCDITSPPIWEIENFVKKANFCSGIIKGRTYWEAKLCGKPVCEYIVNANGQIVDFLYESRVSADRYPLLVNQVGSEQVANQILNL